MPPAMMVRSRVPLLASVALLAVLVASPAVAQEKMGGQKFRTSLGATVLMPIGNFGMSMDTARLPSGRAVLEIQSNPVFGFHIGGLRLAPDVVWSDTVDATLNAIGAAEHKWALNAGVLGFRLNFTTGRFRIAPFADGGVGVAQSQRDLGGYFTSSGYRPVTFDTMALMVGGGGGVAVDAIIGPGLTLALVGGYWHFMTPQVWGPDEDGFMPAFAEEGDPLVSPLSGAFAGAGLKLAFASESYYWRHSGKDTEPPVLAVMNPTPDADGIVDIGESTATLTIRGIDRSQIDSIFVGSRKLQLIKGDRTDDGFTVNASAPITLHPGPNQVRYMAFDGAGNKVEGTWEVLGVPLDKEGPTIAFRQPQDDLTISTEKIMVEAIIADRSPINQVTLNGLTVRALEGSAEDREFIGAGPDDFVMKFQSTTNVPTATFDITVAAVDSASNTQIETVKVHRADLAVAQAPAQPQPQAQPAQPVVSQGPEIEVFSPAEWAGGGTRGFSAEPKTSIRVEGAVRYSDAIKEVRVNNKRMSMQVAADNPGMVQFSGFVAPPPPGSNGEIEILAVANDGRQTARKFTAQTSQREVTGIARADQILSSASKRQRWAVVIGVSDYVDPTIGDLEYADDDARAVYEFLRSPEAGMGGIPEENIKLLLNEEATSRNIRSALTTFLRGSTPDDVIFIYIAGHGAPDPYRPDDLYIMAHDTEIEDIAATGVPMATVNAAIQDAYAYNKVLVTDACHSAGVGQGTRALSNNQINSAFLDYMNNSSGGFVAFTASGANQLSQEGEEYGGGHGVFTYYLLEGLKGAADEDGDKVVTLLEAMEYTRNAVRRQTRNAQIPAISLTAYDGFWPMAAVLNEAEGTQPQQ